MISKAHQAAKLRAMREALVAAGFRSLDAQSAVLGLHRSTTWTIISGRHKTTGLSAATINRILAAPDLPVTVRAIVLEYVNDKLAGLYGDNDGPLEAFAARLRIRIEKKSDRQNMTEFEREVRSLIRA
jgi:hypothetical protein